MNLLYKDEQISIPNDIMSINIIIEKVNTIVQAENSVFSHLVVDDVEVFENHEAYIQNHIQKILFVEIITKRKEEMIFETLISIDQYLESCIPALKSLIEESYTKFSDVTWKGLSQLVEGMQWIVRFKEFTNSSPKLPLNWNELETSIRKSEDAFSQLLEGVEGKDTILIMDILNYEILPAYESLKTELDKALINNNDINEHNVN